MTAANPVIPIFLRTDRRDAKRQGASMPLVVDGLETITQDLSETGLSFHSERQYQRGDKIAVTIEYLLDGSHYPLKCEAEVVRVDAAEGGFTVAARLFLGDVADEWAEPAAGDSTVPPRVG